MAQYKVLQDIEAEDKLVGPLTLRQCIYAAIAAAAGYFSFIAISKGVYFLLVIFLPFFIFGAFFAWPWSKQQSTEVWALAKIRFYFKPRRRIWDQSGVKDLVSITVPKRVEKIYTNGLSQTEVRSRLTALADTIDSRGWAVKNVNLNLYSQPSSVAEAQTSDRLLAPSSIPQEVPTIDVTASDDIMDAANNPIAQQFDQMIAASTQAHRQQIMSQMRAPQTQPQATQPPQPPADYWFLNQAPNASTPTMTVTPGTAPEEARGPIAAEPTAEEQAIVDKIKAEHDAISPASYSHMRTLQPLSDAPAPAELAPAPIAPPVAPVTPLAQADIMNLARDNDKNVATLAREARKRQEPPEEVVISLR